MDNPNPFRFFYPLDVRYGDLDPQGHVNNAKFVTYMEAGRFKYLERVGLIRPGTPWDELGIIIAEVQCVYEAPVLYPETLHVCVRTSAIGNKSFTLEYRLQRASDGGVVATGRSVLVAYDYRSGQTRRVPDEWRAAIAAFEG
jgi:acyl-CoA thioester hydrolase